MKTGDVQRQRMNAFTPPRPVDTFFKGDGEARKQSFRRLKLSMDSQCRERPPTRVLAPDLGIFVVF